MINFLRIRTVASGIAWTCNRTVYCCSLALDSKLIIHVSQHVILPSYPFTASLVPDQQRRVWLAGGLNVRPQGLEWISQSEVHSHERFPRILDSTI